jgi:hypothetical protein
VISKHLARPAQGEIMRLRSDAWLERALEEMGEPILRHGRGDEFLAILRKHRDGKA